MTDYLIVGCGLGGIALAEIALQRGKSICVLDDNSQTSSRIAGGIYNPVILKRFSGLQNAKEQLIDLSDFYEKVERKLAVTLNYEMPVLRKFTSVEEQNNWYLACDKPTLDAFLSPQLVKDSYDGVESPFGYGEVLGTGYVDTRLLVEQYQKYLVSEGNFIYETFDYTKLAVHTDHFIYGDIAARHIIFAEGFGIHQNPFFNYLPLDGTKGELLVIKAPKLKINKIINSSIFILPIGDDLFKVGATYNWNDKDNTPTEEGKAELISRIDEVISCDYEIVDHHAGIRPTVRDRKPLLGAHPTNSSMLVFNGLGTRGVMLGPFMAKQLFDFIEVQKPIPPENDIARFLRFYPHPYHN